MHNKFFLLRNYRNRLRILLLSKSFFIYPIIILINKYAPQLNGKTKKI
jgi:hypothetical protein